jgi:hypothetical protein
MKPILKEAFLGNYSQQLTTNFGIVSVLQIDLPKSMIEFNYIDFFSFLKVF